MPMPFNVGNDLGLGTIHSLRESDLKSMIDLFARAVPSSQLHRSIYGCPGVGNYLSFQLRFPSLQEPQHLWGMKTNDQKLIAAAHARAIKAGIHLNILAVDPQAQGMNIGNRMLDYWEQFSKKQYCSLSLDVSKDNFRAFEIYSRHGFREYSRSHEFRLGDEFRRGRWDGVSLFNWPQAVANLHAFGFGKFQLEWRNFEYPVDLHPDYFRIYHPESRLASALRKMDGERDIFLRHPHSEQDSIWHPTGAIIRMIKELK